MNDLISRQAAIDRAVSIPMFGRDVKMVAVSEIKNLPSAQPERKMGKWAMREGELAFWDVCDQCGKKILHRTPFYKFCPNCGADMREG